MKRYIISYIHISSNINSFDSGNPACDPATWSAYDTSCCTAEKPCGIGQGNCEHNNQCAGNLVCGKGLGSCGPGFPTNARCCEKGTCIFIFSIACSPILFHFLVFQNPHSSFYLSI